MSMPRCALRIRTRGNHQMQCKVISPGSCSTWTCVMPASMPMSPIWYWPITSVPSRNRNPFVDHPEWVDLIYLPKLLIAVQSNGVSLSWEANWTNTVIETTPQTTSAWSTFPVGATNIGNQLAVFVATTTNAQQF